MKKLVLNEEICCWNVNIFMSPCNNIALFKKIKKEKEKEKKNKQINGKKGIIRNERGKNGNKLKWQLRNRN